MPTIAQPPFICNGQAALDHELAKFLNQSSTPDDEGNMIFKQGFGDRYPVNFCLEFGTTTASRPIGDFTENNDFATTAQARLVGGVWEPMTTPGEEAASLEDQAKRFEAQAVSFRRRADEVRRTARRG